MAFLKEKIEIEVEEAELKASQVISHYPAAYRWVVIAFFILLIPGYFAVKTASRAYWANQYKGSRLSARVAFQNPKPPKIGTVAITTAGEGIYSAAATIGNENVDLSLDNTPYEFRFFNAKKELIRTVTDKFFLLPNESKYLVVPKISSSEKVSSAEVVLPQELRWQKRLNIPVVPLTVKQSTYGNQSDPAAFVVEGSFQNQSAYDLGQVDLTFLLYDTSGKLLGMSKRSEFSVKSGELRSFKQLWPGVYNTNVGKVQVLASTNTLNEQNITNPRSQGQNSSDLGR